MNQKKSFTSPVAKRLRSARKKKGVSQKQLGIMAGIDEFSASSRVNQYETGKHVPDFDTSARLAKVLSIPVTYLYSNDDELAELILAFSSATKEEKNELMDYLQK